jgi:hypothetical protein
MGSASVIAVTIEYTYAFLHTTLECQLMFCVLFATFVVHLFAAALLAFGLPARRFHNLDLDGSVTWTTATECTVDILQRTFECAEI